MDLALVAVKNLEQKGPHIISPKLDFARFCPFFLAGMP